jgi:hypothetical protein
MSEAYVPRLMPSLHEKVSKAAAEEGVTVDEFINVAVAEKMAHREEREWLKRRLSAVKSPSKVSVSEVLGFLTRSDGRPPEPGDELPEGFVCPEI